MSIYELRTEQSEFFHLFDISAENAALRAPPGSGKTTEVIKQLCKSGKTVGIYLPTWELANEVRATIFKEHPELTVKTRYGRTQILEIGGVDVPMCKKAEETMPLVKIKKSVFKNLCEPCEHFETCRYINTLKERTDVTLYTYNSLILPRNELEGPSEDTVIIDEAFYKTLLKKITIRDTDINECRHYSVELKGHLIAALKGTNFLQDMKPYTNDLNDAHQKMRQYTDIGVFTQSLIIANEWDRSNKIFVHDNQIEVAWLEKLRLEGSKILAIDADLNQRIIEKILPGIKIKELTTDMTAIITQEYTRTFSMTTLRVNSADPTVRAHAIQLLDEVQTFFNDVAKTGKTVLFTYQFLVPEIDVPAGCKVGYFGNLRGKNEWKDFQNVIILGRMQPPIKALEQQARALYCNDSKPIEICEGALPKKDMQYKVAKGVLNQTVKSSYHPDGRVDDFVQQALTESVQGFMRVRPLDSTDTLKNIYILSNAILDIEVNVLKTWKDMKTPSKLEIIYKRLGYIPGSSTELFIKFPELFKKLSAAKDWKRRNITKMSDHTKEFMKLHNLIESPDYVTVARNSRSGILVPDTMPDEEIEKLYENDTDFKLVKKQTT